jgi:endonuclease YncB( thermonuclease family)
MVMGRAILLSLLLASPGLADEFSGSVVGVLDGDTIEVVHAHQTERIRLSGIDCPEKGQAYGQRAKQATSARAFGKMVSLRTFGKDRYGRIIADVILPDGNNLNQLLVKEGMCWWFRKYAPENAVLEELETVAREKRAGLWAEAQPIPPWEWRKAKRTPAP